MTTYTDESGLFSTTLSPDVEIPETKTGGGDGDVEEEENVEELLYGNPEKDAMVKY